MKNILTIFIALASLTVLFSACETEELPEVLPLEEASQLVGSWNLDNSQREVVASLLIPVDRGQASYKDTTYTEKIDLNITLTGSDLTITYTTYNDLGEAGSEQTVTGKYITGESTGGEYSASKKYFTLLDNTNIHAQKADAWITTYTINSINGNSLELSWSHNSSKNAQDTKRYAGMFSKN